MEFQIKEFDNDNFSSPERKEYETQKVWFMMENSPFNLISILLMSEEQREQLFQWALIQPQKRPQLVIEGCGSSQEDFDLINKNFLDSIFSTKRSKRS
jgi:hypothetical protein